MSRDKSNTEDHGSGEVSPHCHVVALRSDLFSPRKFLNTCIIYGFAYHIWSSSVLVRLDDGGDESQDPKLRESGAHDGLEEEDYELDEEGDVDAFIPLGWPRHCKGEFYSASDPEWREFVNIARNIEKQRALKGE